MSQLDLALEAGTSARHLSYVETGKSQPSRAIIARLAGALDLPLRERNVLLMAAGYAPEYPETSLAMPELAPVRRAIELMLEHQEPYPAFVLDRYWDVLQANRAAGRVADFLRGASDGASDGAERGASGHTNMLRQFFDPEDLRAVVTNWEEVAGDLIRHLHDVVAAAPTDLKARSLLDEMLRYPDVPPRWRTRGIGAQPSPVLTVEFRKDNTTLRFFSAITTFATSRDVTIDELRIECTFPADAATAEFCRSLA
jgi:transcriptional regulator with XRE-family HTH domain